MVGQPAVGFIHAVMLPPIFNNAPASSRFNDRQGSDIYHGNQGFRSNVYFGLIDQRGVGRGDSAAHSYIGRGRVAGIGLCVPAAQDEVFEGLIEVFAAVFSREHPCVDDFSRYVGLVGYRAVH